MLSFSGSNAQVMTLTTFCGTVLDFKNLGLKLRLLTRQQSFVDEIDENSRFFPAIFNDFRNNVVNTPNAVVKGVPFAVNMPLKRNSSIEAK